MPVDDTAAPENDSLDVLSLNRLPVIHPVLRKAVIVKNSRLRSVVELYRDRSAGSGHYEVGDLATTLGLQSAHPDILLLRWIALLPAFDAASVRLLLRDIGVGETEKLRVPDVPEVARYIDPVLRTAGEDGAPLDLVLLENALADPNHAGRSVMDRLMLKVSLRPDETVRFVRDAMDTYAAFGLYAHALKDLRPRLAALLDAVRSVAAEPQARKEKVVIPALAELAAGFPEILSSAERRVQAAEKVIATCWSKAVGATLRAQQRQIREVQVLVGYLLAGLSAKLNAWHEAFPPDLMAPVAKRLSFLSLEMTQGLADLRDAAARGTRASSFPMAVLELGANDRGEGFRAFLRAREQ